mgnify:CR=1 FL=1
MESAFQTYPCGVEASSDRASLGTWPCFRRTLVGLKLCADLGLADVLGEFQTYPCGVEASTSYFESVSWGCFRRTLVGLKRMATG